MVKAKEVKKVGTESKVMGAGFSFKFMGVSSQPLDLLRPKRYLFVSARTKHDKTVAGRWVTARAQQNGMNDVCGRGEQ